MQIRNDWGWIFRPKHHYLASSEWDICFLSVERIVPSAISLIQAIEKPLGVECRYVCWSACWDYYWRNRFHSLAIIICNCYLFSHCSNLLGYINHGNTLLHYEPYHNGLRFVRCKKWIICSSFKPPAFWIVYVQFSINLLYASFPLYCFKQIKSGNFFRY